MHLNPKDIDKLMLHYAGKVAEGRKERGLKLNYPEAVAYITYRILEHAREGAALHAAVEAAATYLKAADCMDGVAGMVENVQVEATFTDGTKLVSVDHPIR